VKNAGNSLGGQYDTTKAQGEFQVVSVEVKNIGDKSQMFDASSQKALNASGQEFSADTIASISANGGATSTFLENINPGNQVVGKIAFDVPVGTKLTQISLHDSPFSQGVIVNLS